MLPSWIRSRNCRPRLTYLFAIEMTRRRFASTISFFAWSASRSPFCTMCKILRNSPTSSPVSVDFLIAGDEVLPTLGGQLRHPVEPKRVELGAKIVREEILAQDALA